MKTKLILFTVITLLMGGMACEKETVVIKEISLSFRYLDSEGLDILNSDSKIKIYYLVSGDRVEAKDILPSNLDNTDGFSLRNDEAYNYYYLNVMMNSLEIEKKESITYIQINDYPLDTVRCLHEKKRGYHVISKAWYNSEMIWDEKAVDKGKIGYWLIKIIK